MGRRPCTPLPGSMPSQPSLAGQAASLFPWSRTAAVRGRVRAAWWAAPGAGCGAGGTGSGAGAQSRDGDLEGARAGPGYTPNQGWLRPFSSSARAEAGSDAKGTRGRRCSRRNRRLPGPSLTSSPRADAGSNDAAGASRALFLLRLGTGGGGGAGVSSGRFPRVLEPGGRRRPLPRPARGQLGLTRRARRARSEPAGAGAPPSRGREPRPAPRGPRAVPAVPGAAAERGGAGRAARPGGGP